MRSALQAWALVWAANCMRSALQAWALVWAADCMSSVVKGSPHTTAHLAMRMIKHAGTLQRSGVPCASSSALYRQRCCISGVTSPACQPCGESNFRGEVHSTPAAARRLPESFAIWSTMYSCPDVRASSASRWLSWVTQIGICGAGVGSSSWA